MGKKKIKIYVSLSPSTHKSVPRKIHILTIFPRRKEWVKCQSANPSLSESSCETYFHLLSLRVQRQLTQLECLGEAKEKKKEQGLSEVCIVLLDVENRHIPETSLPSELEEYLFSCHSSAHCSREKEEASLSRLHGSLILKEDGQSSDFFFQKGEKWIYTHSLLVFEYTPLGKSGKWP